MEGAGKQEPIPIGSLPLPRLLQIQKEIEARCEQLGDAVAQLHGAAGRYDEIREALGCLNDSNVGKEMLVPLTDSLYAPGKLEACDKVLVDIGTNYYVEKTVPEAKDFVERKLNYVKKSVAELEGQLDIQSRNMEQITLVVEQKKALQQQQQQQQSASRGR